MTTNRLPLYYTFGNHMHWVDMEWLWGYKVLPDSVRDMLHFCNETGAKGNINFDGIGYEKMAVEAPEALAELREAIAKGKIEVVGASYGQPYGLFHGGESNIRQRIYGVRVVMRLLGVRPRTFWEEEFDFCPQLPQILSGVGYEYASLFFQWTWHTPVVPHENAPSIWWEGLDGSRLLTAPRNALNLHQWPEDFAGLLESPLLREMPTPGIVQWLELMPSPDWMCRSELLLPQLRMLMDNPNFEMRFVTLSEYLKAAAPHATPRRYTLDDVFHGMSLGKNGDLFRRLSRQAEQSALTAESLSAMMGLFGRPYPSWDVYPTWEIEEAWRELLSAQHHDNDECEGLCGFVGQRSYERSLGLTKHIIDRSLLMLADRIDSPLTASGNRTVVYNPLGWSRNAIVEPLWSENKFLVENIPPFGYRVITDDNPALTQVVVEDDAATVSLRRGALKVTVNKASGLITQITSAEFPNGVLRDDTPLGVIEMTRNGELDQFATVKVSVVTAEPRIWIERRGRDGGFVALFVSLAPEMDAIDIHYIADQLLRPDARMHASLQTQIGVNIPNVRLIHDHPYGVSEIKAEGKYLRKYPTGDWMTSPQVFEEVHNPFTALQLLDFVSEGGDKGLLYLHDGSQAMFRNGECVRNILSMYDAWDEDYFIQDLDANVRLVPHGPITHAERWKLAQEFTRPVQVMSSRRTGGNLPPTFGSVWSSAPGVVVSAFYRETEEAGDHLDQYAGKGMGFPYVLRLVELNGEAATTQIRLPGLIAAAYRTNLLGERRENLTISPAQSPIEGIAGEWSKLEVTLRPHEIATLYMDLVYGRKIPRNLDDYRSVWATVHRVDEG